MFTDEATAGNFMRLMLAETRAAGDDPKALDKVYYQIKTAYQSMLTRGIKPDLNAVDNGELMQFLMLHEMTNPRKPRQTAVKKSEVNDFIRWACTYKADQLGQSYTKTHDDFLSHQTRPSQNGITAEQAKGRILAFKKILASAKGEHMKAKAYEFQKILDAFEIEIKSP